MNSINVQLGSRHQVKAGVFMQFDIVCGEVGGAERIYRVPE